MTERVEKLRQTLQEKGCDAFFSFHAPTNQYLTGFRGSTSAVIITPREQIFLCDFRYIEQAQTEVKGFEVREVKGDLCIHLAESLTKLNCKRAAFEPHALTVMEWRILAIHFQGELHECPDIITSLRIIKSEEEVNCIETAQCRAESVLKKVIEHLEPGVTECEIAARIDYELKVTGSDGPAFDTIVLFGTRTSLPHGKPTDQKLQEGDIVLIDFGCKYRGYCSDMTRTFLFGKEKTDWFKEIYETVRTAQESALNAAQSEMSCRELDSVARNIIEAAGFGKYFGHGLGHGVGIEIHESPRLHSHSENLLRPGMVVTIEPGVYIPGKGGVRIEDLIVITPSGYRNLTRYPKSLDEICISK